MIEDSRKVSLGTGLEILVSSDHGFGTDAILLAHFANVKHKDRVIDLGTGCGIIPFLLEKHFSPKEIVGVDIQEKAILQMGASIEDNRLEDKIKAICLDLKQMNKQKEYQGYFDIVTCNPPYKILGTGEKNAKMSHSIARHEVMCTIFDVVESSAFLLKQKGRLCICQRPERLLDVIKAMELHNIQPKKLQFIVKEKNTAPWLFLMEGVKYGNPYLKVMPNLIMYDEKNYTKELLSIYGEM